MKASTRTLLMFTCGVGIAGSCLAQGSLTPPGAPGATMRTLQEVEPRTPISSLPYTISQPGSYYLTGNLYSSSHGIRITCNAVTLDLMGFMLWGDTDTSDNGIFIDGATDSQIRNVVVRNGIVRNFGYGIRAEYAQNCRFEHLISDNEAVGMSLYGNNSTGQCNGNTITDCTLRGKNFYGLYLSGGSSGQCNGNTIANCTISENGSYGVYLSGNVGQCDDNTITDCTISGNGADGVYLTGSLGQCDDNTITDCTINDNGARGVYLYGSSGQCDGNTFTDCTINGNASYGIYLYGASGQCDGNTITDCAISGNGSHGICLYGASGQCDGNTFSDCKINGNASYGVYLYGVDGQCEGNTITDCRMRNNSPGGIYLFSATGNLVESNHISGEPGNTAVGIRIPSGTERNLVIRNTCIGLLDNYNIHSLNTYGPIVTGTGSLLTTGAEAHPWANFDL